MSNDESLETKQARFEEILKHTKEEYGQMRVAFNALNQTVQDLGRDVFQAQDNKEKIESLTARITEVESENSGFRTTFKLLGSALLIAVGLTTWMLKTEYDHQVILTQLQDAVARFNQYPEDKRK